VASATTAWRRHSQRLIMHAQSHRGGFITGQQAPPATSLKPVCMNTIIPIIGSLICTLLFVFASCAKYEETTTAATGTSGTSTHGTTSTTKKSSTKKSSASSSTEASPSPSPAKTWLAPGAPGRRANQQMAGEHPPGETNSPPPEQADTPPPLNPDRL
jgi:hypothetical protein